MQSLKPILLVEDDNVDAEMTKRAFSDLEVANELIRVKDGQDALNYLNDPETANPCFILLDLNMPNMDGFEFLTIAKNDDVIKMIPIVILSTSNDYHDIDKCFHYSVAGYILKNVNYEDYVESMKKLNMYWTLNELP